MPSSYGDVQTNPLDMQYMLHLVDLARGLLGEELVLYTTDGGVIWYYYTQVLPLYEN